MFVFVKQKYSHGAPVLVLVPGSCSLYTNFLNRMGKHVPQTAKKASQLCALTTLRAFSHIVCAPYTEHTSSSDDEQCWEQIRRFWHFHAWQIKFSRQHLAVVNKCWFTSKKKKNELCHRGKSKRSKKYQKKKMQLEVQTAIKNTSQLDALSKFPLRVVAH